MVVQDFCKIKIKYSMTSGFSKLSDPFLISFSIMNYSLKSQLSIPSFLRRQSIVLTFTIVFRSKKRLDNRPLSIIKEKRESQCSPSSHTSNLIHKLDGQVEKHKGPQSDLSSINVSLIDQILLIFIVIMYQRWH